MSREPFFVVLFTNGLKQFFRQGTVVVTVEFNMPLQILNERRDIKAMPTFKAPNQGPEH